MTVADLGSGTLGVAVPAGPALGAAVSGSVAIAAPDVSAQLAAAAGFTASASLGLSAQVTIAQQIIANLQAAIAAGITAPSLAVQAQLALDVQADLTLKLADLDAFLQVWLDLQGFFAQAGVRVLTFDGPQNDFGAELAAELGSDTTNAQAIVLLTQSSAAWTAMQGVLKTS